MHDSAQSVRAVERHHRDGDEVRSEQRNHDGQCQCRKQVLAHAEEKGDREKDDDGDERDRQNGQRHLVRAFLGGHGGILAQFDVSENIFEHDHRIVDQAREGQGQAAQNHAVDRLVARVEKKKRGHHGKRNRKKDSRRRSGTTKENQNHQRREQQADSTFAEHGGNRLFHEQRLIEHDVGLQLRGNIAQVLDGALRFR